MRNSFSYFRFFKSFFSFLSNILPVLRPTPWVEKKSKDDVSMLMTLKDSVSLFTTTNMLMFSVTMFFTGLNQSLWAGVYSGCIGWTKG